MWARDIYVININQVGSPIIVVYVIKQESAATCGQALPPRWAEALSLQQTRGETKNEGNLIILLECVACGVQRYVLLNTYIQYRPANQNRTIPHFKDLT